MRIAVYAGTFDPITYGHLSVVERARTLFDRVVVLVASHPTKTPMFDQNERVAMASEAVACFADVGVASTRGYVVRFARDHGAEFLIRGVRSAMEMKYEMALAYANQALAPEVETVFVAAHPDLAAVSSSRLKTLAAAGADLSRLCSGAVEQRLHLRLAAALMKEGHRGQV
ncbi:MAG: pantetheine-phosphate adenylyltransferase [Myxococcota bacterium]